MAAYLQNIVQRYLKEVLGVVLGFKHWEGYTAFPDHLKNTYEFKQCELLGQTFLLFFSSNPELTPAVIEKHMDWVDRKTGMQGIFVTEYLESYNRKRLIDRKVPFVVPENQLYIPDLGLDIREHFKKAKKAAETLSPVSQVIVISYLLRRLKNAEALSPTRLAKQFPYSKMSMSRSLDELRSLQLVETQGRGRSAFSQFVCQRQRLWQKAKPFARSPVSKRIYLDETFHQPSYNAGESALSEITMLAKPRLETWAVTSKEWKKLQRESSVYIVPEVSREMASAELEIWSYAPSLLSNGPIVDPFSLALSLQYHNDERVEMAIEQLLDTIKW